MKINKLIKILKYCLCDTCGWLDKNNNQCVLYGGICETEKGKVYRLSICIDNEKNYNGKI